MPPGSAQPDFFYDSFCTSCQSSHCRSSCVFASAVSVPSRRQVIRALPEPSMLAPVVCGNSCSALKEEPLYDFPLHLGFDNPAPCPMRRFCISAIGIESPTAANLSLTRTCQSSEPVPESKPDNITSRAPKHKGVVFTKYQPETHDTPPWPAVAKIVRGLGIPFEDNDFYCLMDCNTPENHIENQPMKLEPDNSWLSNPEPIPPRTQLLVKLLSPEGKLPTRGNDDVAGYDLYSCETMILETGTRKRVNTGISIAIPSTRMYARIAP